MDVPPTQTGPELACQTGMFECLQRRIFGAHRRGIAQPTILRSADVGDESGAEPCQVPRVGDAGNPQPVRCRGAELAVDQIAGR